MSLLIVILLFIAAPILGYFLFTGLFDLICGNNDDDEYDYSKPTKFIDKSVHHHHHYHDNRQIHVDGEKFKSLINKDGPEEKG